MLSKVPLRFRHTILIINNVYLQAQVPGSRSGVSCSTLSSGSMTKIWKVPKSEKCQKWKNRKFSKTLFFRNLSENVLWTSYWRHTAQQLCFWIDFARKCTWNKICPHWMSFEWGSNGDRAQAPGPFKIIASIITTYWWTTALFSFCATGIF